MSLADQNYRDLNYMAKFNSENRFVKMFNDDKTEKSILLREHLFYLQVTGVFLTSEATPTNEIRKWNGESAICNLKGRKKFHFIGRDVMPSSFSKLIVKAPWTFLGADKIPADWPLEGINLWPIKTGCRTIYL